MWKRVWRSVEEGLDSRRPRGRQVGHREVEEGSAVAGGRRVFMMVTSMAVVVTNCAKINHVTTLHRQLTK